MIRPDEEEAAQEILDQKEEEKPSAVTRLFKIYWWLWRATVRGCVMVMPNVLGVVWPGLFGLFAIVETIGIIRKGKDDTQSETHWAQLRGEPAMRFWVISNGILYAWLYLHLPFLAEWVEPPTDWWMLMVYIVAQTIVAAGLGSWLTLHYIRWKREDT